MLLSSMTEATTTINADAIAVETMLETPFWQLGLIAVAAAAVFILFFILVFILVSAILKWIDKLIDMYYKKKGKKRPVSRRRKNSGKNF